MTEQTPAPTPSNQSDLARRVYATSHLTGTYLLRSGQTSSEYFDKYLFEANPALLREVATAMVPLLPDCDVLAGMERGGIPLATVMSQLTGLPTCFVRKQAKEYGTRKLAEGAAVAGRRVVLVEDVVTTAGARPVNLPIFVRGHRSTVHGQAQARTPSETA